VKSSFLILLLSISINTYAGERLKGISGSMSNGANPFSKLLGNSTLINNTDDQSSAEQDAEISLPVKQDEQLTPAPTQINPIADINAEFDDINKPVMTESKPVQKKPTQLFTNAVESVQTTNKTSAIQAVNHITTPQVQDLAEACVKEKVYSLDVDNASQYKRLEDFPFTYECVTRR
jgi:hypothetical protein